MAGDGTSERTWRRARTRGISPIIATILLVAITVVLAAVFYVMVSGLTSGGVGSRPIGGAFSAEHPIASTCTGAGSTYAANGCVTGDYIYILTVESASAAFSDVRFEVQTLAGSTLILSAGVGGFTVATATNPIAAQMVPASATMGMASSFAYSGLCNGVACSGMIQFSSAHTIMIDMGTQNPANHGYTFIVVGTGSYSGTSLPLALP